MRPENLSKAKKCSKFRRRASLHDRMFELIIHAKAKAGDFADEFVVILSAAALPIVLKVELSFEVILYITIFIF